MFSTATQDDMTAACSLLLATQFGLPAWQLFLSHVLLVMYTAS